MTIACPDCGAVTELPPLPPRSTAICPLCGRDLEKTSGRSITAALACSLGTFLLLIPANALPLLKVQMFNVQSQNVLGRGIAVLWDQHWVLIAGSTALFVVVFPFIIFGLFSVVLGCLRFGYRPDWLRPAFRWAVQLDLWGMPDVFLLAAFVGYYRMIHLGPAHVTIGMGGLCFMAAGLLSMIFRAALDRRTVWRVLGPEIHVPADAEMLSCTCCDLALPLSCAGEPCPRCRAILRPRKRDALPRTAALLAAALVFFIPANLLPMNVSEQLGTHVGYTIFTGVRDLFQNGLWPLGALIFCTSIAIPFGKIIALGWCVASVWRGSSAHLLSRTKISRLVAELGRWSKTDPFVIVFFVPLVDFGGLASSSAGWGATAFMAMSILTMLASTTFDPRLMWDVA